MARLLKSGDVVPKFEMNMDQMEELIGRKIGTFEKMILLEKPNGGYTEWHFILNVWRNCSIDY